MSNCFSVDNDPLTVVALHQYSQLLFNANRQFNLSALRSLEEIEQQLVCQSVRLVEYLPDHCTRLLDVGAGGGIPGVPIAICKPALSVDLIDATAKKVNFMNSAATTLNLHNVEAFHGRAEELGHDPEFRASYDAVTARALAAMPTLVEYTLPFLKQGGIALYPKGSDPQDEIARAEEAITALGGRLRAVVSDESFGGSLIIIDKTNPTPERYPRRTGIPGKRPIGVPS